jgi:hypothetical protein
MGPRALRLSEVFYTFIWKKYPNFTCGKRRGILKNTQGTALGLSKEAPSRG